MLTNSDSRSNQGFPQGLGNEILIVCDSKNCPKFTNCFECQNGLDSHVYL